MTACRTAAAAPARTSAPSLLPGRDRGDRAARAVPAAMLHQARALDRSLGPEPGDEEEAGGEGPGDRARGIGGVQVADGAADAVEAADVEAAGDRKGGPHQEGRDDGRHEGGEEQLGERRDAEEAAQDFEVRRHPAQQRRRQQSEQADQQLGRPKGEDRVPEADRQPRPRSSPRGDAEQEGDQDDREALRRRGPVEDAEEPGPDHLVPEGGEPGDGDD